MTIAVETSVAQVAEAVVCAHCKLPLPAGLVVAEREHQFCCHGCETVFTLIHSCRLDRYYKYRDADATPVEPAKTTGKGYREFDFPAFLEMHAPRASSVEGSPRTTDFYLEGVHCAACVWLVEKLPQINAGVASARLDLSKSLVRITWSEELTKLSNIARLLDSLGYPPHPARSANSRQIRTLDARRQLIRIGAAGACAGNAMLLGTALYAGLFANMDPAYTVAFRYLSTALGLVAIFWPGLVFFRGAMAAIRMRTPHLDVPIALALASGAVVGALNTVTNRGEIYFDSLAVLVFLLLVGRYLQYQKQTASDDALELLFSLTPMSARRIGESGEAVDVPIASLAVGDVIEVLPGECVAADGVIVAGRSSIDESLLTGEAAPKAVAEESPVFAGTTNVSSPLRVKVAASGEATRVGKLMRLVTECARQKAPIVLFADRIAARFLVSVLAVAVFTFLLWTLMGSGAALDHAVAILIVSCPCALGLATPLAVTVSIGRAARRGILIKGGATLERLARGAKSGGMLLLDKTGTITTGRLSLVEYAGEESLKPVIAALEKFSTHPLARALAAALGDANMAFAGVTQHRQGISAVLDGRQIKIGSPAYVQAAARSTEWVESALKAALAKGLTPVLVAVNDQIRAACFLGDQVRPDVPATLAALKKQGWEIGILSGDHPAVVARIARQLEIPEAMAHGGLLPEDKLRMVHEAVAKKKNVVMVGDGVNDAAALAAASVGIAVHGGAEASLAAANVYLRTPGLRPILDLTTASRQTLAVIRRALYASLTYNLFAVSLAVCGLITPLIAAVLMPISSLTVLSLALATRTFGSARR